MYDYWRLFIEDKQQVLNILQNPLFEFKQVFDKTSAEIFEFPQTASWQNWRLEVFSPTHLQIMGSIHKFANNGTNETDFTFSDAKKAINSFCEVFQLNPALARVTNLEFGVNVQPAVPADVIIQEVLCYKNTRPLRPYESRKNYFFIEFDVGEYYIKLYDKGKQYRTRNTLRFEIKGVKNRFFRFAGIETLKDLLNPRTFSLLGVKIDQFFKSVIIGDSQIDCSQLNRTEEKCYLLMKDANEWARYKRRRNSTNRHREKRFLKIVKNHGRLQYHDLVSNLIKEKVQQLCEY